MSKKIRSSFKTKSQQGQFLGTYPPLGYFKDPEDKHHLIVDEVGAKVIRHIFEMSASGMSCGEIALKLRDENVPTTREYWASIGLFQPNSFNPKLPPKWQSSTVRHLLQNHVYLGCVVNGRMTTKSFKNKTKVNRDEDEWIIVHDCHEPLVSEETFELAQRSVHTRKRKVYEHRENIFAGFVKCATCGTNASICHSNNISCGSAFFCNRYRIRGAKDGGNLCTAHYIPYEQLYGAVLDDIRYHALSAKKNESNLRKYAEQMSQSNGDKESVQAKKELAKIKKRFDELETIISRLFEQNALGVVSDERFISLSGKYETEQTVLKTKITELQGKLDSTKNTTDNMIKLFSAIARYVDVDSLDRGILNEFIEKIVVHEATEKRVNRKQKLEIHYRLVGVLARE